MNKVFVIMNTTSYYNYYSLDQNISIYDAKHHALFDTLDYTLCNNCKYTFDKIEVDLIFHSDWSYIFGERRVIKVEQQNGN